ncbi:hypothetical protein QEH59_08260 [Coraliomargarita sp. SDUM461004]|uniref:Flp pilus assembly protein RcpC/CpaB domain-containing protein n=1 Tax=Thalassobacterium sedimentorum TaxID=3041258 RepID=A0ABU1AI24_9BACT|nr:hypothetical protein [Coraliomargarita sp. SDUM461004]MDQ8194416.1 hypothetical protein [Coraliomargarita sp. SDUM461004]
MNKIYDKLILAVAVLLLAGGVALYLKQANATPSMSAPVNAQTGDSPYEAVPMKPSQSVDASWPEVEAQPSGPKWIYDVFTPPKIYVDMSTGEFSADPPVQVAPPPPFGVYLASIDRKPYRIQLEGYIEEDRSDPSKTLLLLFDEEAQKQVRARPGTEKEEAEIELLNFDIQRIRDADNNIEVIAKATILDQRTGEEVVLTHGERRYDSGVTVVIRSNEDSSYVKELTEAPTEFEGPLGQYTLEEINLEETSVTVKKHAIEDGEPETVTLEVESAASSTPTTNNTPTNDQNEDVSDAFDLMF